MASKRVEYHSWSPYLIFCFFFSINCIYSLSFINFLLLEQQQPAPLWMRNLYLSLFDFFWFMCVWSLLTVLNSDVKLPSKQYKLPPEDQTRYNSTDVVERNNLLLEYATRHSLQVRPKQRVLVPGEQPVPCVEYCGQCVLLMPPGTVHCRICRTCVAMHDHHCSVLGICINYSSLKAFTTFLCYYFCLGVVLVATIAPNITTIWSELETRSVGYLCQSVVVTALMGYSGLFGLYAGGFSTLYIRELCKINGKNPVYWPLPISKHN